MVAGNICLKRNLLKSIKNQLKSDSKIERVNSIDLIFAFQTHALFELKFKEKEMAKSRSIKQEPLQLNGANPIRIFSRFTMLYLLASVDRIRAVELALDASRADFGGSPVGGNEIGGGINQLAQIGAELELDPDQY